MLKQNRIRDRKTEVMELIEVSGIKIFAYHGCLEEEAIIGGNYIVDVAVEADVSQSAVADDLDKTIDYGTICEIVKEEMGQRSKLIETVAHRILAKIKGTWKSIDLATVTVRKLRPPVDADVEEVSVTVTG